MGGKSVNPEIFKRDITLVEKPQENMTAKMKCLCHQSVVNPGRMQANNVVAPMHVHS